MATLRTILPAVESEIATIIQRLTPTGNAGVRFRWHTRTSERGTDIRECVGSGFVRVFDFGQWEMLSHEWFGAGTSGVKCRCELIISYPGAAAWSTDAVEDAAHIRRALHDTGTQVAGCSIREIRDIPRTENVSSEEAFFSVLTVDVYADTTE